MHSVSTNSAATPGSVPADIVAGRPVAAGQKHAGHQYGVARQSQQAPLAHMSPTAGETLFDRLQT